MLFQQPITAQLYTKLGECFLSSNVHCGGPPSLGTQEFSSINPPPEYLGPPITINLSPQALKASPHPLTEPALSGNLPIVNHFFFSLLLPHLHIRVIGSIQLIIHNRNKRRCFSWWWHTITSLLSTASRR
ncbi:hypothetical protein YC2023_116221 [Brassica napus]